MNESIVIRGSDRRRSARGRGSVAACLIMGSLSLFAGCARGQHTTMPLSCVEGTNGTPGTGRSPQELAALGRVIQSGMRTAMLAGDGLTVREFLGDLKRSAGDVDVELYSATGELVYAAKGSKPDPATLPPAVRQVIEERRTLRPAPGSIALPLKNDEPCQACHKEGDLRAVMTLTFRPTVSQGEDALRPLAKITDAAFEAMMTIGKATAADDYLQGLPREVPGLLSAAVLSHDGKPSLGDGFLELPAAFSKRALTPTEPFTMEVADGNLVAVPLPNRPRCLNCHKPSEMRGALVLKFSRKIDREDAASRLMSASVRHVMLTGLGRLTKKFLNDAAGSGFFAGLTVHDGEGRLFHDMNFKPTPPPFVSEVLRTTRGLVSRPGASEEMVVLPVNNEDKCRRCHDEAGPLRAVIAVRSVRHTPNPLDPTRPGDKNASGAPQAFGLRN